MNDAGPDALVTTDGVRLALHRSGQGPPLVCVHGSATTHRCFAPVAAALGAEHAVTRYDRRGHGASGDGPDWSLDREVDDLIEVVGVVGGGDPVCVLGYSFGGVVALEALRRPGASVQAAVVYEPPYGVTAPPEVDELLAAGQGDAAARLFVSTTFQLPQEVVEAMARHPLWADTLAAAGNLRRELPVVAASRVSPPDGPYPPVGVLVAAAGGNPAFGEAADEIGRALGAERVAVPGLPHFAMATAPDEFAAATLGLFRRLCG